MNVSLSDLPINATPTAERQRLLLAIADHICIQRTCGERSDLVFICTHNSRRSQLAQVWASVAANHYGIKRVFCWSGGTEATAFHPNAIASLTRSGFQVTQEGTSNPNVLVTYKQEVEAISCFSKVWNHAKNPQEDIAAIMVCDDAEQNCPLIPGALIRVGLSYTDPKIADGTSEESATYDLRSAQIAQEMFWLFKQLCHE